jgi:hypothetical protein
MGLILHSAWQYGNVSIDLYQFHNMTACLVICKSDREVLNTAINIVEPFFQVYIRKIMILDCPFELNSDPTALVVQPSVNLQWYGRLGCTRVDEGTLECSWAMP